MKKVYHCLSLTVLPLVSARLSFVFLWEVKLPGMTLMMAHQGHEARAIFVPAKPPFVSQDMNEAQSVSSVGVLT